MTERKSVGIGGGPIPIVKSTFVAPLLTALIVVLVFAGGGIVSPPPGASSDIARHEQMMLSPRDSRSGKELLDPLGRPDPVCRSLYGQKFSSRASPLIFERDNLVVCQTPKIGTTELRCIHNYYDARKKFQERRPDGHRCHPRYVEALAQVQDIKDVAIFDDYLYGDDKDRIMFVRHPVRRILSGFLQVTEAQEPRRFWRRYEFDEDLGNGPDAFRTFVMDSTFMFQYDGSCSHASTYVTQDAWFQHYAPPQHCRCGIWDCGVKWKAYKVEEHSVAEVMKRYVPGRWISPEAGPRLHHKTYEERDYLTDEVLEVLNHLTRYEREFFGYEPLSFED